MRDIVVNETNNIKIRCIDENDVIDIRNYIRMFKTDESITKEFKNRFGIDLKSIIAFGDTEDVPKGLLKDIIPKVKQQEYQCYLIPKPLIVIHEDLGSSWNCLLLKCGKPKNVIIYRDGKKRN